MHAAEAYIAANPLVAALVLLAAFVVLSKGASVFVDSAVALANRFGIPKLVIGIVLVSFATTAPELAVSLLSALKGQPEMALGNAIGSVICDDGLALALAGVFALTPIVILPRVLRTSGVFLLSIEIIAFAFILPDYTLSRTEGAVLVGLFLAYSGFLYHQHKTGKYRKEPEADTPEEFADLSGTRMALLFLLGLGGIIVASEFIVVSATSIARAFHVPESVIALTLVAFGTSIPEAATCVIAARKGHGDIAAGNILGADIMNICWVAGASALANDLTLGAREVYFMFPAMFVVVGAMLILLYHEYRLTRAKGIALFVLYLIYLGLSVYLFPPDIEKTTAAPAPAAVVDGKP